MNPNEILKNEAFNNIEEEKIEAVKKIIEETKGKSSVEASMIVMKYAKQLRTGKEVTLEQRDAMLKALYDGLTDKGKEEFKGILQVIEKFA